MLWTLGQHSSHEREIPPGGEQIIAAVLPHERPGQNPLLLHLLAGGFHEGLCPEERLGCSQEPTSRNFEVGI